MLPQSERIEVRVRAGNGTYQTSRVRGMAASCTAGPEQAARALGHKLYGDGLLSVTQNMAVTCSYGVTLWAIEGPPND